MSVRGVMEMVVVVAMVETTGEDHWRCSSQIDRKLGDNLPGQLTWKGDYGSGQLTGFRRWFVKTADRMQMMYEESWQDGGSDIWMYKDSWQDDDIRRQLTGWWQLTGWRQLTGWWHMKTADRMMTYEDSWQGRETRDQDRWEDAGRWWIRISWAPCHLGFFPAFPTLPWNTK